MPIKAKSFFLIIFLVLILTSCSGFQKVTVKNKTPMAAAKTFVKGMIAGNPAYFKNLIYTPNSPSPQELVEIAKNRKITGMKMSQFHFKKDPTEKDTILVNFKDADGDKTYWKLYFLGESNGTYEFMGSNSSPLINNNTLVQAAKVWFRGMTENKPYLIIQMLPRDLRCDRNCATGRIKESGLVGLNVSQFKFQPDQKTSQVKVTFKDQSGQVEQHSYQFSFDGPGNKYGYLFAYQIDAGITLKINDTPTNAARHVIAGMILGKPKLIQPLLVAGAPKNESQQMVQVAKDDGIYKKMKLQDFTFQQSENDRTVITVSFKDANGKKITWTLHFKKKKGNYYLSESDILSTNKRAG